jgi:hypothetical protein
MHGQSGSGDECAIEAPMVAGLSSGTISNSDVDVRFPRTDFFYRGAACVLIGRRGGHDWCHGMDQ